MDTTQPSDDDAAPDDDAGDDDTGTDDDADDDTDEPIDVEIEDGCNPFATSDLCVLPFPSAFFQRDDPESPTGVRMNYPDDTLPVPEGTPPLDMAPTNAADGASPAGPILLHFGRDVDPADLTGFFDLPESVAPGNPIALFDWDAGRRVMFLSEMDMNRRDDFPDRYALIVRPMEPMEMGHRHVVVLTRDVDGADGEPFPVPLPFLVLRDGIPTTNDLIEEVRPHYEDLFAFLDGHGYAREDLLLAWDFMVASPEYLTGSVVSMRDRALDEMGGTGLGYAITSIEDDPNEYAARVVKGTFEVPTFLRADNSFEYDADHHPVRQETNLSFPFTMVIPKKARDLAVPLPLVVFGHGLFGSGESYLAGWGAETIQPIAQEAGAILVATDWIGLASGDLELILQEVVPNLNRITIVTDRLQQSLINNLTLTELAIGSLSSDPQVRVADNELIDPDRVYYYGVSLGGIQGSSFTAISNRVRRGILAVPGSVWFNMFPRSIHWLLIKPFMDLMYPDPLVQQLGTAFIQMRFDLSDPVNLTRLLFRDPLPDAPADRAVILQESIGDCQVPNMTTEMLARAVGAKLLVPSVYDVPALEEVPSPTTESVLAQYYLVEQVEQYAPPPENVPPTQDNGVHADMVFLPHALQQVRHFLETGEVVQYCDGMCDPD